MARKLFPRIVLLLSLVLAAGCDDSGTGPEVGAVNFGTLSAGTGKLIDTYVTGNATILGSLVDAIAGIQTVLAAAAPAGNPLSMAPAQTCVAASLVGKVFDNDGAGYAETGETGPADGVRFILRDTSSGPTSTLDPIGYLDIVCGSTPPDVDMTVTLVANSVTVTELGMSGLYNTFPTLTLDGFYAAFDGSSQLSIRSGQLNGGLTAFEFRVLPDLAAGYSLNEGLTGNIQALFSAHEGLETPKWNLDVSLIESSTGPVAQGTAVFQGELVACISGGLSTPVADDPKDTGCSLPETPVGSVSKADREAMMEAYRNIRILYGFLAYLAELGLGAASG